MSLMLDLLSIKKPTLLLGKEPLGSARSRPSNAHTPNRRLLLASASHSPMTKPDKGSKS